MQGMSNLTARQIKAARALLDWSQDDLAKATHLSVATIRKIETGNISPRGKTNDDIRHAFENAGLEFIEPGGVRYCPEDIKVYQGHEGAKAFFDDVYHTAKTRGGECIILHPSARKFFVTVLGDYHLIHVARMAAIKDGYSVKCIITEDENILPAASYCEYRWMSKRYIDAAPFYVYNDKYALIILDAEPSPKIIVIQSHAVAEALRQQFYSMWEKATPLNKLEKPQSPSGKKRFEKR